MYVPIQLMPGVRLGKNVQKKIIISDLVEKHSDPRAAGFSRPGQVERSKRQDKLIPLSENINLDLIVEFGRKGWAKLPKKLEIFRKDEHIYVGAYRNGTLYGELEAKGDRVFRSVRKIIQAIGRRGQVEPEEFCEEFGGRRFFKTAGGADAVRAVVEMLIEKNVLRQDVHAQFIVKPHGQENYEKACLAAELESRGVVDAGWGEWGAEKVYGDILSLTHKKPNGRITKKEILVEIGRSGLIQKAGLAFKIVKDCGMLMTPEKGSFLLVDNGVIVQRQETTQYLELTGEGLTLARQMGLMFRETRTAGRHYA